MLIFCCSILDVSHSYNALERRESSKGGKETNRRTSVPSQTATKSASKKAQASSHGPKRANGHVANTPQRTAKTSISAHSGGPAYDEQVSCSDQKSVCVNFSLKILLGLKSRINSCHDVVCRSLNWNSWLITLRRRHIYISPSCGTSSSCARTQRLNMCP